MAPETAQRVTVLDGSAVSIGTREAPRIIAVTGPTASGKTALAIELAERLHAEIISADSMQVYKGMEIGSAAPTPEERARVPHHLVSFLEPGAPYSAGMFERKARAIIDDLARRGHETVVVAGGSGLYLRALLEGLFPGPERDDVIRARLQDEAEAVGAPALFAQLERVDPDYAATIHPNDLRRIIRAIEVHELTGRPFSAWRREHRATATSMQAVSIAIDHPRDVLYDRINRRVDAMIERGFVDEVQRLLDAGHARHIDHLRALGYREFAACLCGEGGCEEAVETMKRNTRRFAKRQLTWFRADPKIRWLKGTPEKTPSEYVRELEDQGVVAMR